MYKVDNNKRQHFGNLMAERKACNKMNCHCAIDNNLHIATYLYYRRLEDGKWKLHKRYVKQNDIPKIRKKIAYHKLKYQKLREKERAKIEKEKAQSRETRAFLAETNDFLRFLTKKRMEMLLRGEYSPELYHRLRMEHLV